MGVLGKLSILINIDFYFWGICSYSCSGFPDSEILQLFKCFGHHFDSYYHILLGEARKTPYEVRLYVYISKLELTYYNMRYVLIRGFLQPSEEV